jgi:hypothetical protein
MVLLAGFSGIGQAQELRYSWFEMSYVAQDVDRMASQTDIGLGQTVNIEARDGDGIRFRGSLGTWKNLFLFVDYASSDIDVIGEVINQGGTFPAADSFDHILIRAGGGFRWPIGFNTDVYGALSLDYLDLDFGSFAGESFDLNEQDLGGQLGIRTLLWDELELHAFGRYTNVGDPDITNSVFDADTLVGVGFGWELIRGLSITGEYESGELSRWSLGFRLDLSEDTIR